MKRAVALIGLILMLGGCGQEPAASSEPAPTTGAPVQAAAEEADRMSVVEPDDAAPDGEDPGEYEADAGADPLLDDLPPIRTGPMAAVGDPSPWDSELASERQAQLDLPRVDHPLWTTLRQSRISIDERSQMFTASHPAAVRAMDGRRVTVRGYMLPLEASDRTGHFLISPYTPVCFFHPPAEPNEVIEVRLSRPIEAGYHLVEVTGVLRLANDGEKGLFFVIPEGSARIVERIIV